MSKRIIPSLVLTSAIAFVLAPASIFGAYVPEAMVTFTFDDGARRIYENAAPLFQAHNMPAVLFGETGPLNSGEDWVMSWSQIKDLQSKGWEIGSHTITHPDLTTLTDQQLEQELLGSKQDFAEQGINVKAFASPLGKYNAKVLRAIAKHYTSSRAAWGGLNALPQNDYEIISLEAKHTISPETVKGWVDEAIANKQWLVILLHDVVDGTPLEYEYNKNDLKQIVDYVASKPIKVTTISEGLEISNNPNLIQNSSFETIKEAFAENWTRNNTNVVIATANRGNFPNAKNSLRILGGAEQREAISAFIPVENADYILKMFYDGLGITKEGWAIWISEYGTNEEYLTGQWLGGEYSPFFGTRSYNYRPSTASVAKIKIHIYTEAGTAGYLFVDSVSLQKVGVAVPPPPPPPPASNILSNPSFELVEASGFASGWTNNNSSNVQIDQNNNGYGSLPKNSLKITGSATQNTAFSPIISIDDPSKEYQISYHARTDNWQSGGTALWINEFNPTGDWIGGQWLGGRYEELNGVITYSFKPSSPLAYSIDAHIFTEENSSMTLFVDDVFVGKK